jgi:hypothetical protein
MLRKWHDFDAQVPILTWAVSRGAPRYCVVSP